MKNFNVDHMQENGTAKKTLSRKEYDEQLKMRFAAMEDEKHEKLSAQAKEEFEQKTEAEKQEFMNTINDVENKPLTYDLIKALEEHKDLTFYCLATTGLNTADKKKTIKNGNGYEERFIQKDEPTYFMAETYHYDERQKAYVPSDSIAVFIEASKEVVDRAIEQANAGGYDVFANADFNLDDYLAGKNVKTKDEAKAAIGEYFDKASSGIVLCYGEFHDNMLRGNDFPIPEDSLDLNRVMGEQGTFGTASLGKCVNQILKTDKTNALDLFSTTEKLAADVICLNKIASLEMDEPVKIQVREELIDKFSDKDRELILGADESVRLTVKPRIRQRRPMGPDNMRERLHRRDMGHNIPERDISDADSPRGTDNPRGADLRGADSGRADAPRGFVRRQPRTEITAEQTSERQQNAQEQNAQASERKRLTKRRNPAMEMSEGQPKGPEKQPEGQIFFGSGEEKPEAPEITDEDIMDFFEDQADAASVTEKTMPDERTTPERATSERAEAGQPVSGPVTGGTSDDAGPQSRDEKRIETPSVSLQDAEALKTAGMGMLLQALMRQNELLQERNEISMKQNEIESAKIAEMQKQTELMERQAKQMEQLTVLMDNLTKVYSMSEVERLKMDTPILPIPVAETPGKGVPTLGNPASKTPDRGSEMPARRGGLAKRHPDGYYANAGRTAESARQADDGERDGSRIVDPKRVIESRRQAEEKETGTDNVEEPVPERTGFVRERGRKPEDRKPEREPDSRTKSVAEQARELKGNMDAVLEGLMNPDGHEMSVEEPIRRGPHGRIKEDDDIGRP
jgi:hypothetical protein